MSLVILVKGNSFRIDSTSHKYVHNDSSLKLHSASAARNALLTDLIIDFSDPPVHCLRGGLKFQLILFVLGW